MFRSRSKDEQAATAKVTADQPQQPRDPQAPKGRPTPKRSAAQSQRRSLANTPTNRKEAAKRQKEARRSDLARQREALAGGDERYLPARDKGPVRRFVRDFVDSRFAVAELFLPIAVLIMVLAIVPAGSMQSYVMLAWVVVIVLIAVNSIVLSLQLKRALREKFPDESTRGLVFYALSRTLQMRRLRLPKPQVKRGERP